MSKPHSRPATECYALSLIDEIIEFSEKNYQNLPANVQNRVNSILAMFKSKTVKCNNSSEIGDLIASLAELIPVSSELFSDLCKSIADLCIDREFVQFTDEALDTVSTIILERLELPGYDPSSALCALSRLFYNNTLRLEHIHEKALDSAISLSVFSDEALRQSCVLVGNINAFSKQKLNRQIYTRSVRFLLQVISQAKTDSIVSSALRSLQLLILDAPSEILDPQVLAHTFSGIAFKHNTNSLKYEAIKALKALANTSKKALYAQWSMLLTNQYSLFDLLRANPRVSKATADLLTDIFRDTWKFLYMADNTSKRTAFTTLAQQNGTIIEVSFNKFLAILGKNGNQLILDKQVFNRVAKAFATFVRNCSFDNGRLNGNFVERIVEWARLVLNDATEEALIVMKSLLWTDIKYQPFADSFDFLFETFLNYIDSDNPDFLKPAAFALCRMAYAYPDEIIARYVPLQTKLDQIGPVHSLPIYLRLAEKGVTDMRMWLDILQKQIPKAFEINHTKSIQRSLQIIGLSGNVFSDLPDNIQRFCLSMVLSNESPDAVHSVGLLARSSAADISSVFLTDALLRLTSYSPPPLQPLSNVLEAFATRHKDTFEKKWIQPVINCFEGDNSPYAPRCIGFLFAFIDPNDSFSSTLMNTLINNLQNEEAKIRWNAASALANAFTFGAESETAVSILTSYIENDKIAKVKIKSADALFHLNSRNKLGSLYHQLFGTVLNQLLIPAHFTNLPLATHRKYNSTYREVLTNLFFKLLEWSKASDFTTLEEQLISNVDSIYDFLDSHENSPWKEITRLYEAKFNSIPSTTLEKFQDRAFPV